MAWAGCLLEAVMKLLQTTIAKLFNRLTNILSTGVNKRLMWSMSIQVLLVSSFGSCPLAHVNFTENIGFVTDMESGTSYPRACYQCSCVMVALVCDHNIQP